jgi:uncharacterized protein YciI
MPTQTDKKVTEILKPMLKKKLFVALSKALVAPEDMLVYLPEHLADMNHMESEGNIFASGPFLQEGALVGDGLTILQTNTIEEARVIMQAEPLIKRSLREFDLRPWELREGRMTIILNASTSSFRIDSSIRLQIQG